MWVYRTFSSILQLFALSVTSSVPDPSPSVELDMFCRALLALICREDLFLPSAVNMWVLSLSFSAVAVCAINSFWGSLIPNCLMIWAWLQLEPALKPRMLGGIPSEVPGH